MYDQFNMLARTYLDHQHLRVACEHRVIKLVQKTLNLAPEATHESEPSETALIFSEPSEEAREASEPNRKAIIQSEPAPEATTISEPFKEARRSREPREGANKRGVTFKDMVTAYKDSKKQDVIIDTLMAYRKTIHKEELEMLKSSSKIMKAEPLSEWCGKVRGLGPVALMTFLGFLDPLEATSAGKCWAYLGFAPGSKFTSGEQGTFNPEAKGRFWLLGRNVIMARDPYYTALYKAKKEYYLNRPDLVALKDAKKGWKGWIDNMAKRWMVKLLISHAWEIMRKSNGLSVNPHRGYIPPKPGDGFEAKAILDRAVPNILKGVRGD